MRAAAVRLDARIPRCRGCGRGHETFGEWGLTCPQSTPAALIATRSSVLILAMLLVAGGVICDDGALPSDSRSSSAPDPLNTAQVRSTPVENVDGPNAVASGGTVVDWFGNLWTRAGSPGDVGGPGEANWYIDDLAAGDVSSIQYALDRYYLWSLPGMSRRWGKGWLAKHIVVVLLMRAYELRNQLSPEQLSALDELAADALDESTLRIDGCGVVGNSCVEDFGSMMVVAAIARNLYPGVGSLLGDAELERLERKYFRLTFTSRNGSFGLVRENSVIDGHEYAIVQNHSGQSAVYAAIVLTQLGNALDAHLAGGRAIPSFFVDEPEQAENIRSLFAWLQTTALPDGSSFLTGCLDYTTGQPVSCSDPAFANAVPTLVPGGRAIALLYGEWAFRPGFRFQDFDLAGYYGLLSEGRKYQYNDINTDSVNLGLTASLAEGTLLVSWSSNGAAIYDVWGPLGRVGTTSGTSYSLTIGASRGRIGFGVVTKAPSGRVTGYQFDSIERYRPRRRLSRNESTPRNSHGPLGHEGERQ